MHAKAKEAPDFCFSALYDKVYRKDVLTYAYERCQANGGAAGVDNQTFEDIEEYGKERWLDELTQKLRVYIPKPDGKQRPIGIATVSANCTIGQLTIGMGRDLASLLRRLSNAKGMTGFGMLRRLRNGFRLKS